jgi:hypothetical protein
MAGHAVDAPDEVQPPMQSRSGIHFAGCISLAPGTAGRCDCADASRLLGVPNG